jgi:hypothetical protein
MDRSRTFIGGIRSACKILARKLEGKIPLGRPRHQWDKNIKRGIGYDWIPLAPGRGRWWALLNTVMIFRVP